MEYTEFKALLCAAFQKNGLEIPTESQADAFYRFTNLLMETNQTTNLTAIRNIPDVIYKHYVDSLLASKYFPIGATVLDIGCGPGFPSIPLAVWRPDLTITALDSTAKKIAFVQAARDELGLQNLTAITGRAEDQAVRQKIGLVDVVTSRAVARLNVLSELCIPYLKINGRLVALKGAKAAEELDEAQNAIKILGGSDALLVNTNLATEEEAEVRGIILITKKAASPQKYPRPYAAILKKPL